MGPMGYLVDQVGVQCGGPPACRCFIAIQHAIDLPPCFALRKGARRGRENGLHADVTTLESLELLCQCVQVKIVLAARPPGFQGNRKVFSCGYGFHQFLGSNATEPEGEAASDGAARYEEGAARALSKPCPEEGTGLQCLSQQMHEVVLAHQPDDHLGRGGGGRAPIFG